MIVVSEKISLKLLTVEDAPAIFDLLDQEREYFRKWLPFVDQTHRVEDTERAIVTFIDPLNPSFSIVYDDKIVGLVGFKDTQKDNKKTEIGYWLSKDYQGRGIVTNSVISLLEYAFIVTDMNRVTIKVAVGNKKSRILAERIGFMPEGIEREAELLVDNVFTDVVVYSLLKKEYLKLANS